MLEAVENILQHHAEGDRTCLPAPSPSP
jgi:hypothetical protein